MVHYKRKPVKYRENPPIQDDNTEVWVIPETKEIFLTYEDYLHRMDYYKLKRFTCEITGHSQLTYFEALKSERNGSMEVDEAFPDALKEPVLRRVQFSTTSRVDILVDQVYDDFKRDFFPGEKVTVLLHDGERLDGLVREKAKFPEIVSPNGVVERRSFSRYFVRLTHRPHEEALVDDEHIVRDRKTFTKQILRSYLKNCLTRESWAGAPWLVKTPLAIEYRIDTEVPLRLRQDHKLAEKKAHMAMRKGEHEGQINFFVNGTPKLPELKPAIKGQNKKYSLEEQETFREESLQELQRAMNGNPTFVVSKGGKGQKEQLHAQEAKNHPGLQQLVAKSQPKPTPPPPIKYPIEDLDVTPLRDGTHRPNLKWMSQDYPGHKGHYDRTNGSGIFMSTVGPLLEVWSMLNVFCPVFLLDSFTFDDFAEAMEFSSDEVDCELRTEIHCAVLKLLVNAENDEDGMINVSLPEAEDDESESSEEPSRVPSPVPEVSKKGMRTRSSLSKVENAEDVPETNGNGIKPQGVHRAEELFKTYGWIERLRKRDFKDGGWEVIIVGVLHQLQNDLRHKTKIDDILSQLCPMDAAPTQESVRIAYQTLNFNARVEALEYLTMLTVQTDEIRNYMLASQSAMTEMRKEKIDHQRKRKEILEELRALQEEAKQLQPNEPTPTPPPELKELDDAKMTGVDTEEEDPEEDDEDGEPIQAHSLRRGADRAAQRKRKQEEERERREKAEATVKLTKEEKQYQKVLKKIDDAKNRIKGCEEKVNGCDADLREADCARLRVIGYDRFWNRYYWLERNAMPYDGLPDSSTADAGYSCARLFVRGPEEDERTGFIDVTPEENREYFRKFQMTVPERKKLEEGPTSVFRATEWGYYDDPDSIEMLMGWLDVHGKRELKLRKELEKLRETMTKYMENRKEYLSTEDKDNTEEPTTRMSTRTKTYVDPSSHRCLTWTNNTARREIGHLHSEQPVKQGRKRKSGADEPKTVKATNRQGKPLTRQGTRYNFT